MVGFVEFADTHKLRAFLSDLLDQGFGGSALVLVAYALFLIQFPAKDGFVLIPHPVNQSGASSRQRSDLDIELNGEPFLGVELKDKPFVSDDVSRAADVAKASGLNSLLFVSGRHAGITSVPSYFSDVKAEYAKKQINVGIIQIDELMDFVLVTHPNSIDAAGILSAVYDCVSNIGGTVETQTWVYSRLNKL